MFSSRCGIEAVPGIGSITGDLASSHARATWAGVAFFIFAIDLIFSDFKEEPAPSGYHGRKATPSFSQVFSTFSEERSSTLYRFCTETIVQIFRADSSCFTLTLERPTWRIFPSRCAS